MQPENFGDIVDAFIWSLSKFIGGVGGYGDFEPITFWGQVMATVVGLLGIALFAVPAGIIGAGFVEEIEAIKNDEALVEKNKLFRIQTKLLLVCLILLVTGYVSM